MVAKKTTQTMAVKKNTEQDRTLYLRFPKTIKNIDEIRNLIVGDADIKLPRQSSRNCHIVFSAVNDKIKNLKVIKEKIENEKSGILVSCVKLNREICEKSEKTVKKTEEKEKKKQKILKRKLQKSLLELKSKTGKKLGKKPVLPKILTKTIIVFKIPRGTNLPEVKEAFPDCQTVTWIIPKSLKGKKPIAGKIAMVKLSSKEIAKEYLTKKRSWPIIHEGQVIIKADKRQTLKQKTQRPESSVLKIYDGGKDVSKQMELKKKSGKAKLNASKPESDEEKEDIDEEEEEEEEDDSEVEEEEDSEVENEEDDEENENSDDEN